MKNIDTWESTEIDLTNLKKLVFDQCEIKPNEKTATISEIKSWNDGMKIIRAAGVLIHERRIRLNVIQNTIRRDSR